MTRGAGVLEALPLWREDRRKLTGAARFIEDLRLPGVLWVELVRSPHAHARLERIDLAAARAHPGVELAVACEDLRSTVGLAPLLYPLLEGGEPIRAQSPHRTLLEGEEVTHVGQPVAAVVARSRGAARDAAELASVRYEPLPAVLDAAAAAGVEAPRAHSSLRSNVSWRWRVAGGDVDAALARADRVLRERLETPRFLPAPLEMRGVAAQWDAAREELTVWASTQTPHQVRAQLAAFLDLAEGAVRVIVPEVGGSFGTKLGAYAEELLIAWLALRAAPRPVQWIESRRESAVASRQGGGIVAEIEAAVREDGRLLGLRCEATVDLGAACELFAPAVPTLLGAMAGGAYDVAAIEARVTGVLTNKTPLGSWRGAGSAEAAMAIERIVERVARELELDAIEVRRSNFPRQLPHTTCTGLTRDSGDYARALDRVVELSSLASMQVEQEARRARGELVGIGVASYVAASGFGPSPALGGPGWERACVRVVGPASVEVVTGATALGQGLETAFARIAAERLGIAPDAVRVVSGDTARVPFGAGSFGGRTAAVGGAAVHEAARRVEQKMRRVAAAALGVPVEYVGRAGERFVAGDRSLAFADVFSVAHRLPFSRGETDGSPPLPPGLEAESSFEPQGLTFPFGSHVCRVAIDRETGEARVERYFAVDDCGAAIDPDLVDGQLRGGIAHGLARLFCAGPGDAESIETIVPPTGSSLPASDLPPIACERTSTPSPCNPLGVKGVSDAGTVGALAAAYNAVADALRPLGIETAVPPFTPERLWRLIRDARPA